MKAKTILAVIGLGSVSILSGCSGGGSGGERKSGARRHVELCRASLSAREAEVMSLMLQGQLNKQIGDTLGIAMRTVEVHRSRVLAKMGVRNIAELASILNDAG